MSTARPSDRLRPTDPGPGTRIGPYTVLGALGEGGMGAVYHAQDPQGREVALKLLNRATISIQSLERFRREAELTASLRHVGIVAIHGAGEVPGWPPYIAYVLVPGGLTLEAVLGAGDRDRSLGLILQAAEALGFAHARGVVHRDVKPANVLVTPDGRAQVADFGLAQAAGLERLTRTGAAVGTPECMAPEQVAGERDAYGPPTDVWALGVLLYRALTGQPPFRADSLTGLAAQIAGQEPARPRQLDRGIPAALEAVCWRALRKDPAARYADGDAFAADLRAALAGEATDARPPSAWARTLATLAVSAGVLAALALTLRSGAPAGASPAPAATSREDARATAREARLVERLTEALDTLEADPGSGGLTLRRLDRDALSASATCQDRLRATQATWAARAALHAGQAELDVDALLTDLQILAALAATLPADAPPFPDASATTDAVFRLLGSPHFTDREATPFLLALVEAKARVGDQIQAMGYLRLFSMGLSQSEWRFSQDVARRLMVAFAQLDVGFRNGIALQDLESLEGFAPRGDDVWSRYTRLRFLAKPGSAGERERAELAELAADPALELGPAHRAELTTLAALAAPDLERRLRGFDDAFEVDPDCVAASYQRAVALAEVERYAEAWEAYERARDRFADLGLETDIYASLQQRPVLVMLGVRILAGLDRREEARAALAEWYALGGKRPHVAKELERYPWLELE